MFCRYFILSLTFVLCCLTVSAQSGLVRSYPLGDCTMNDIIGNNNGITFGTNCGCGVNTNGIRFEGSEDFAEFDQGLNEILRGNWTISFFVQINNQGTESVDLLFLGERCGLDSILSLRYLPASQRFRFILSDSPNNEVQVDGLADNNSCWQYVAIVKERATVRFYINGVLEAEDAARSDLALTVDGVLSISNSPCQELVANADVALNAVLDEIRVYNRALTTREVADNHLFPDKIITSDTTIFKGNSIRLQTGGSCSNDFEWSPVTGLDDPNQLNPLATPDEDIQYTLTVTGDNCQSVSVVMVRVADETLVTCDDLVLPSAFTPNNDRINDVYAISNRFIIDELQSFEIFNKWGGRVFATTDVRASWDGTYQGEPAPPTSYVYKVVYRCENEIRTKSGTVNLLR